MRSILKTSIYKGTDIEGAIEAVFARLGAFVPADIVKKLSRITILFVATEKFAKDYSGKQELIAELANAMLSQITCYTAYQSFSGGDVVNFAIDSLHFLEKNKGLYLFARATHSGYIRVLAVERIQSITPIDKILDAR